jgi:hypothetical protein
MKTLVRISAAAAFLLCLLGGLWILFHGKNKDDALSIGIGLYVIGKALFVGPMLLATAAQIDIGRLHQSAE